MRTDLIRQLSALQARRVSLDEFELWLVAHLQQVIALGDPEVRMFVDRMDALLIQFGESLVSEVEFEGAIEDILRNLTTYREPIVQSPTYTKTEIASNARELEVRFMDLGATQEYRLLPQVVLA